MVRRGRDRPRLGATVVPERLRASGRVAHVDGLVPPEDDVAASSRALKPPPLDRLAALQQQTAVSPPHVSPPRTRGAEGNDIFHLTTRPE